MHRMHIISLGFILAISTYSLSAQNWAPFYPGDTAHFVIDTGSFISHSIWIDSSQIDGPDSIHFFNRIGVQAGFDGVWANQSQFLGDTMIQLAPTIYQFEGESGFLLYANENVGVGWNWDIDQGIMATVQAKDTMQVLGQLDSVKTIVLNTGDTVLLSQHHGLIRIPASYATGHYYELVGFQNRSLGRLYPTFWDFFSFGAGDVFYVVKGSFNWPGNAYDYYLKSEVLSKSIVGDSLKFSVRSFGKRITYFGPAPVEEPVDTFFESWVYVNDRTELANLIPGQFLPSSNPCSVGFPDSLSRDLILGDSLSKTSVELFSPVDSIPDLYKWNELQVSYATNRYEVGLGHVKMFCSYFESERSKTLLGAIIDGDSIGEILADSILVTVGVESDLEPVPIQLYPNPLQSELIVELPGPEYQPGTITLFDQAGRIVLTESLSQIPQTIHVGDLPKGLYLAEIQLQGEAVFWEKLVK